jgi:nitroreductase
MTMSRSTDAQSPDFDEATMRAALELALRAPSLHNSQPWRWRLDGATAYLYLDSTRRLPATDPHARELVISCGAALHHLQVALAAEGREARVRRLPDPADPACLASVTLTGRLPGPADTALANAIPVRRTDRRRFTSWPVPAELIGELSELADLRGLRLQAITEPLPRYRLFRAISDAAERQANDPAQAAELAAWSGRAAGSPDGVPAVNTPPSRSTPGRPRMRPFADPQLSEADHGGEPEAATLLLLSTTSDWPIYWLAAGEVASAVLLTATRDGLASSVLSQPLEVGDTRAFLYEHVVRAKPWHPQLLLRLGWLPAETPPLPPTPRRPLEELLVAGNQTG